MIQLLASMNVLILGGRAPVALELGRLFHKGGHKVFSAESFPYSLLSHSNTISGRFSIPSPRNNLNDYKEALIKIIDNNNIDLVIPTCEEVYYIAKLRDEFPKKSKIFVDRFEKIMKLHNKWHFIQQAKKYNLPVPETILLNTSNKNRLVTKKSRVVLKPVYSRFSTKTIITENPNLSIKKIKISQVPVETSYEGKKRGAEPAPPGMRG